MIIVQPSLFAVEGYRWINNAPFQPCVVVKVTWPQQALLYILLRGCHMLIIEDRLVDLLFSYHESTLSYDKSTPRPVDNVYCRSQLYLKYLMIVYCINRHARYLHKTCLSVFICLYCNHKHWGIGMRISQKGMMRYLSPYNLFGEYQSRF